MTALGLQSTPTKMGNVHGSTGSMIAEGIGKACFNVVKSDGTTHKLRLINILYCPSFATNVISQASFKRKGAWYHSGQDKLYTASNEELAYLPEIDGITNFLVVADPSEAPAALSYASLHAFLSSADEPCATRLAADWHHIYGHANIKALKCTAKAVKGMELTTSTLPDCRPCGLAKSKHSISHLRQATPSRILEKVHVDIVGPVSTDGMDGERYWMLRTDGKSRRHWMSTSDSKAVLGNELNVWCRQMKTQTGLTVGTIFSDNAREFLSARNKQYFNSEGISVQTSPPHDASRNGIGERVNGIEEDLVRAALIAAGLPASMWPWAAEYTARIQNLTASSILPGYITPIESWNRGIGYPNPIPNVAKLQAFGHAGYTQIPAGKCVKGDKFAPRAERGHLVGMIGEHIY
jgi:hypothetical protein